MRKCFLCGKEIFGCAWEFAEGLAHPDCAMTATARLDLKGKEPKPNAVHKG